MVGEVVDRLRVDAMHGRLEGFHRDSLRDRHAALPDPAARGTLV